RLFDQRHIALDVRETQKRNAGLARAEKLAGTANQQVLARDLETVRDLIDHLESLARRVGHRLLEQQYAGAFRCTAAHASPELMQLRKTEALGVLDDH